MRLSVVEGDPGFQPGLYRQDVEIRLNGLIVQYVETADEEEGMVVVHDLEATREQHAAEIIRKTLYGDVWILMGERK